MNIDQVKSLITTIIESNDSWPNVNVSLQGHLNFHIWNEQFVARCKELGVPLEETNFEDEVEENLRVEVNETIDKFIQKGIDSTVSSECKLEDSETNGRKRYQAIVDKFGGEFTLQVAVQLITQYLSKPVPTIEIKQFWENIISKFSVEELGGIVYIAHIPQESQDLIFQEIDKSDATLSMATIEKSCEALNVQRPEIISFSFKGNKRSYAKPDRLNGSKKKSIRCKYCTAFGHVVSECRKLKSKRASESRKQEVH